MPKTKKTAKGSVDAECIRRIANISSLSFWTRFDNPTFDKKKLAQQLPVLAPKIHALIENIIQLDEKDVEQHNTTFKHFIFSDVSGGYGAKAIASALIAYGVDLAFNKKLELYNDDGENRFLLMCSGKVYNKEYSAGRKQDFFKAFNKRPHNIYGETTARIIVLDGGYKEGVDLFDVKYAHILEPQLSQAHTQQVIGRATRTCGQKGLEFQPNIGWPLDVFIYDMRLPKSFGDSTFGAEALKHTGIDLTRFYFASKFEDLVKYGAVDASLTKVIHSNRQPNNGFNFNSDCSNITLNVQELLFLWLAEEGNNVPREMIGKNVNRRAVLCKYAHINDNYGDRIQQAMTVSRKELYRYFFDNLDVVRQNMYVDTVYPMLPGSFKHKMMDTMMKYGAVIPDRDLWLGKGGLKKRSEKDQTEDEHAYRKFVNLRSEIERKYYDEYAWPYMPLENGCIEKSTSSSKKSKKSKQSKKGDVASTIVFNPTQRFLPQYFTPSSDVKGMLLWHSVGTGKTCSAVSIASRSFEKDDYTILWVTRSTLKSGVDKATHTWSHERCHPTGNLKNWLPILSYKQFSNFVSGRNQAILQRLQRINGSKDPLRKTLIIIDEAHKLYNNEDMNVQERPDMKKFKKAIMKSYDLSGKKSARILLLTATPWVKDPMEMIQLINMMKDTDEQLTENYDEFLNTYYDEKSNDFSEVGRRILLGDLAGHVSVLDRSKDIRMFAQPTIHNVIVDNNSTSSSGDNSEEALVEAQRLEAEYTQKLADCEAEAIASGKKRGYKKQCKESLADLEAAFKAAKKAAKPKKKTKADPTDHATVLQRCYK